MLRVFRGLIHINDKEAVLGALRKSTWYAPGIFQYAKNIWLVLGDAQVTLYTYSFLNQPGKGLSVAVPNAEIETALQEVPDILDRLKESLEPEEKSADINEGPYYDI